MSSKWFRYGFLIFFLTMFGNMVFQTYLVGAGAASLREAIKLFWTFRVPWGWTYTAGIVADWVAQFSFGFYILAMSSACKEVTVAPFNSPPGIEPIRIPAISEEVRSIPFKEVR